MELINLFQFAGNNNVSTCFLCTKPCTETDTDTLLDFIDIYSKFTSEKFQTFNVPSPKTCKDCSNLLFQISNIVKRNINCKQILMAIINNIENDQTSIITENEELNITLCPPVDCQLHLDVNIVSNLAKARGLNAQNLSENSEVYECKKCEMKFQNMLLLHKHKKISHSVTHKARLCEVCGKTFETTAGLKSHFNSHKLANCPQCDKVLKTHSHFQLHVKKHKKFTKRKSGKTTCTYKCNVCDYVTSKTNTLEGHVNKVHLNVRPYRCDVCNKTFYTKSNLLEHVTTHSISKNHTCDKCGDGFANKKCLQDHLKLHLGVKPHVCELCDERFVNVSRKNEHIKMKHEFRYETCDICGKQFSLKRSLNKHMKQVHSDR